MNKITGMLMALVLTAGAVHADSGPTISVTNAQKGGTRRVEIIIQDPISTSEIAPTSIPEAVQPLTPPDGGAIQGTMVTGGKYYAVTEKRMLTAGDKIAGHTVTQVRLDHVTISRGARTYELDCNTGEWALASANVAE